jgi:cobalt-zinc-cadmium efflux system outer membrane protein
MHRKTRTTLWPLRLGVVACLAGAPLAALAQTLAPAMAPASTPAPSTTQAASLAQAFEAAWARQPEALALQARRDAARATQQAAQAWTPEPAALELGAKTERLTRHQGSREYDVGLAVPLWLPGERQQSAALANATAGAVESHAKAAQLRVAAAVREAWWQWQRALVDTGAARDQLDNASRIAADVAKRHSRGDLARADQHQADGAVAAAESAWAQAEATVVASRLQLQSLTGLRVAEQAAPSAEPDTDEGAADINAHASVLDLQHRSTVARHAAALAGTQTRANPELTLATTRARGGTGEAYGQTVTLGLRFPLGAGPRQDARRASADAEHTELQAQLALERERLAAERQSAAARVAAGRTQLAAADRRARLAAESRGFFDKSFRLGETDLPTRLRIEAEAADAQRQQARAGIDLAAAVSAWRQALGLLPQ